MSPIRSESCSWSRTGPSAARFLIADAAAFLPIVVLARLRASEIPSVGGGAASVPPAGRVVKPGCAANPSLCNENAISSLQILHASLFMPVLTGFFPIEPGEGNDPAPGG